MKKADKIQAAVERDLKELDKRAEDILGLVGEGKFAEAGKAMRLLQKDANKTLRDTQQLKDAPSYYFVTDSAEDKAMRGEARRFRIAEMHAIAEHITFLIEYLQTCIKPIHRAQMGMEQESQSTQRRAA